ncbi:O-antigen ligase family protein [Desulfobacter postgatei]|uniref:O-antigen ligase family protein n=1 Tax=Desulfobacter postgatei TaxID=2293 RepID=UPI00259B59CA|nr:O-antigen ligase family protein [uncultured Desulfobacter sp.]
MPTTVIVFVVLYFWGIWRAFTRNPIWGLWPYSMSLYMSPAHNWFGVYLPNLRWSLLASLCTLISIYLHKAKLPIKTPCLSTGPAIIILCYTIWMWIQLIWALDPEMHLDASILLTKYLVLYYIVYTVLNTDENYFKFILFNILGSFYISREVLNYSASGRVEGVGGPGINDSNSLGMHLSVILILCGIILLKKNTIFRNSLHWRICQGGVFISTAYIANAVVQTISRSAVLGLAAGGMLLLIIKHWSVKKKFYMYCVLAIMGLMYFAPYTFWDRLNTIKEAAQGGEVESSAYSRIVIGKAMIEMFQDNILGNGHRGTVVLSPYYMPGEYLTTVDGSVGRASHCTFLTTLTEQGVPGAILYLMMVFWTAKTILTFRKDDPVIYLYFMGAAASLAAIFIAGIFVDYLKAEVQIYCFAMLASLKDYEKRRLIQSYLEQKR